ncbi:hypothetical protein [Moraxella sp. ZY210820]|uniref:hypothetical protein n=1 Tax=unclassified Moraxella TaxID=2685852 RepID=UPI0027315834|nr:hypothetical protein [Moraxella sp. ZY210820]WLF84606.1 hypothetical protein LU301_03795 [Moraxella sp. ZY210820]
MFLEFDLERMKRAIDAPVIRVPDFDTDEQFLIWLNVKKDFVEKLDSNHDLSHQAQNM